MAEQVNITVTDLIPPANIATIDNTSMQGNTYTKIQVDGKTASITEEFNTKLGEVEQRIETDFKGTIKPTDSAPTEDGSYKPEISSNDDKPTDPNSTADWGKVYPNAGNLRAKTGYNTMFYKKGSVWTRSETKMPEVEVNGVVEASNTNAVSGGAVYSSLSPLMVIGKGNITFTLRSGTFDATTGAIGSSTQWISADFPASPYSIYSFTGYSADANSKNTRVGFWNGTTYLGFLAGGNGEEFFFTTPANTTKVSVTIENGTNVGANPSTSHYNTDFKVYLKDDYLKGEKIKGTINTTQIANIENNILDYYASKSEENTFFKQNFYFTKSVSTTNYKQISIFEAPAVNHLNFASTVDNKISYLECVIKNMASLGSIRLGFGNNDSCFQVVKERAVNGVVDFYIMNRYGVTSLGSSSFTPTIGLNVGDKVAVRRSGANISFFINNKFITSRDLSAQGNINNDYKGVIGFRDLTRFWTAGDVVAKKRSSPYIHFSVDDSIGVFKEIFTSNPVSIFENARLAYYKSLHDQFGATFSLFAFYQNSDASFNLTQMPATWKAEFIANSHWLKIGFHGVDSTTSYTTIPLADGVEHYTRIVNEINRFAGYSTIDNMPRFSMFTGNNALFTELKKYGLVGVLTADDNRTDNSGLTASEITNMNAGDDYYNYEIGFYFVRSSRRLDVFDGTGTTDLLKTDFNSVNNNNIYELFFHEGRELNSAGKLAIEAACNFAKNNNIRFDFPQNNILN